MKLRFQFRLRTLFVVVTLAAVICAFSVLLYRRREASYTKFTEQGVNVTVIHPYAGSMLAGKTAWKPGKQSTTRAGTK